MPKLMRPITQSDYLISIANVKGVFSKFSGGEEEFDTSDYVDPSDRRKKKVRGVVMVNDITLAKPFHPTEDAALVDLWQKYRDDGTPEEGFTVTVQAIKNDRSRTPIGKPRTYYGCQIIKFTRPEADLEGSDVAMLEIEMSVDHVEEA